MGNAYFKSIQKDRRAWAESVPQRCMICRKRGVPFDIHEICRRSQAPRSYAHPANYALLCRRCHESRLVTHSGHWSICVQLGFKMLRDEASYDLRKWNEIRNPSAPNYVTQEDVDVAIFEYMTGVRAC